MALLTRHLGDRTWTGEVRGASSWASAALMAEPWCWSCLGLTWPSLCLFLCFFHVKMDIQQLVSLLRWKLRTARWRWGGVIQELSAGGCYRAQKDVFRTCPGALRKASRQATKRVGGGKTLVQKFLRDNWGQGEHLGELSLCKSSKKHHLLVAVRAGALGWKKQRGVSSRKWVS